MKVVTLFVVLFASSVFASEIPLTCSGGASVPGASLFGNCFNNNCSASAPGGSVFANGNCGSGVSFQASGYYGGSSVSGYCMNGSLNAYIGGSSVSFTGTCSNGGRFEATAYTPAESVFTSCSENGSFFANTPGGYIYISGICTTN